MPSGTTFAPTSIQQFTSAAVHYNGLKANGTIPFGTTANVDLKLNDDHLITGGLFMTKNAAWGDTVLLQVVDVDNLLGYGAGTVLNQFVAWFLSDSPTGGIHIQLEVPYPAKIPAGFYLRMVYASTGSTDVQIAMNYMLHKVMF